MGITECMKKYMEEQVSTVLQPQQQACNDYAREGVVAIVNDYVDSVNAARDTFSGSNLREAQAQHEYKRASDRLVAFHNGLSRAPQCQGVVAPDVLANASALLFDRVRDAEEKEQLPHEDVAAWAMVANNRWMGANKLSTQIRYRPKGDAGFLFFGTWFAIPGAVVSAAEASVAGAGAATATWAGAIGAASGAALFGGLLAVAEGVVYISKVNTDIPHASVWEL